MTEAESLFGRERALTDLLSNHVVFKDQEHFRKLLRAQDLPVYTFSPFIHEATHHWCNISPVGTALSLLYLSVAKKALRWMTTDDESQLREALNDLFTFKVAVEWLEPLSEGLALFAEYDVLPPESGPLLSPPLDATLTHLFNLPRRLVNSPRADNTWVLYELADDISKWRLSEQTIERKGNLLLEPISSLKGRYLLGYLAVKQLWRSSARFYEDLKDADVFLMFIRKLVFGDYALVAEILDRKRPLFQRGARIGQSLYERLYAIRMMAFAEDVPWPEWERVLTTPSTEESADFTAVFNPADRVLFAALDTKELVLKGMKLQEEYFREVTEPIDLRTDKLSLPPDYFVNVLRERRLMWLGDVSATWRSTGRQEGRIMVDGAVAFDNFKLTNTPDKGLNRLKLDIYIDLYERYQLTTVANEHGVFGFAARPNVREQAQSLLTKEKLDPFQIRMMTDLIHKVLRKYYVVGTNYQDLLDKFWATGGRDLLDTSYLGFAFNFNKEAESVFVQRGLEDVLQDDYELVLDVAAISLAASAGMSPEGLVTMSDRSLNPLDTIRRVSELWGIDDFALASIDDDGFLRSEF